MHWSRRLGRVVTRRTDIHPKVFISHASEDKKRFVRGFATRLRQEAGVDAWVDEWEIYPGDSLVQKIFEEGLKDAQAVIIILSNHSVNKPWVREELDAGVVKKVAGLTRLIPVVIDDCEVPESLKATVWQRIEDLDHYDAEFDRIVAAIYGHRDKPALGAQPEYTQTVVDTLPGLTPLDTLVLKLSCERAIETEDYFIQTHEVWEQAKASGVPKLEFNDSLEILNGMGYIRTGRETIGSAGEGPRSYTVQIHGFEEYAKAFVANYGHLKESVAFHVVNHVREETVGRVINHSISEDLGEPKMVVNHILKLLQQRGLVQLTESAEGRMWVMGVSAQLRRTLSS